MNPQQFPSTSTPATSRHVPGPARRQEPPAFDFGLFELPELQAEHPHYVDVLYGGMQAMTRRIGEGMGAVNHTVSSLMQTVASLTETVAVLSHSNTVLTQEVAALRHDLNQRLPVVQNQQGPPVIPTPGLSQIVSPVAVAEQSDEPSQPTVQDMEVVLSRGEDSSRHEDTLPPLRRSRRIQNQRSLSQVPSPQPSTSYQPPQRRRPAVQRPQLVNSQSSVDDEADVPPYQRPPYILENYPIPDVNEFNTLNNRLQGEDKESLMEYIRKKTGDKRDRNFVKAVYNLLFTNAFASTLYWYSADPEIAKLKGSKIFKAIDEVVRTREDLTMTTKQHGNRWRDFLNRKHKDAKKTPQNQSSVPE